MIRIFRAPEFIDWFEQQTEKSKVQIDDRLSKIQDQEHFGDHRFVGTSSIAVWELRWKNGRRVYYAYLPEKSIFIRRRKKCPKQRHRARKTSLQEIHRLES